MNFLCKLLLLTILVSFRVEAQAQEVGTGLFCDTPDQVLSFIENRRSGMNNAVALQKVNGETNACAIQPIAFIRGKTVASVPYGGDYVDIVEILVIGYIDGQSVRPIPPTTQYTMFKAEGRSA